MEYNHVVVTRWFLIVVTVALLGGCGGPSKPPKRGVLEKDVSSWGFRRYQAVLDPEVWVKDNQAQGFTASYVRKQAEKQGRLDEADVVNAFVTRFDSNAGLIPALVRFARRLAQESGYVVEEEKFSGTRVIVVKGHGEMWAWWVAKKHVLKVGGRGVEKVPKKLVEAYADLYPSKLKAGALDMELEQEEEAEVETEAYDSKNPKPEWQRTTKKKRRKKKRRNKKK